MRLWSFGAVDAEHARFGSVFARATVDACSIMQAPTLWSLAARDGTKLIADVWNVNANSTLLLLPAGAETRSVWHSVVDHFPTDSKNRWRSVAADHRGHGDSGRSESYLFQDFIDDLLTWIGQLSARPLVVAGGSIGGALAMVAAGEGAAIDGLAILDVPIVHALERVMFEGRRIQAAARTGHASIASIDPRYISGGGLIEDVYKDIDRWKRAACRLIIPALLIAGESGSAHGRAGTIASTFHTARLNICRQVIWWRETIQRGWQPYSIGF